MCCGQQRNALGYEVPKDAIYDSQGLPSFVGVDLSCKPVPDAITGLGFRRLLEDLGLSTTIFEAVNSQL